MAAELRADLCATLPQADATLAERSTLPTVDATALATLQGLARRLARAERIAVRTRERALTDVEHRLAATGAGLAVHPTTIRERAAAVDAARTAVAAAQQAIDDHAARIVAVEERAQAEAAEAAARAAEPEDDHRGGHVLPSGRARAIGLLVAGFGVALVLLALGVDLWAALIPPLLAALLALRLLQPHQDPEDLEDRREASSLLSQVSASADELFGARRAARDLEEQLTLLQAQLGRAEEERRVAERAWHDLAGEDVDVSELEDVVRRFDPQHEDARVLADETVGVRTVEVVLHHVEQRWLGLWRELGLDAPSAAEGEAAVRDLAARVNRPVVLVGPAIERADELARVAPAAPVVVLEGPTDDASAFEESAS